MPLNDTRNSSSSLLVKEKSQRKSYTWEERNIGNRDLFASQIGSLLELSLNNFQDSQIVFLSSFIGFFGDVSEAKSAVEDSGMAG